MILGTMASAFMRHNGTGHGYLDSLVECHAAGFDAMDPNMGALHKGKNELCHDDWEAIAYRLREEAEKLSMAMPQAHLPFAEPLTRRSGPEDRGSEQNPYFREMMERAIRICSILGVKWGVVHPLNVEGGLEFEAENDLAYNYEYYAPYVELADKLGVGIAFENLADVDGRRRYGVTSSEILAIMNRFDCENVKLCWDFGHANRTYRDTESQVKALEKIVPYLRATHLDDNVGKDDLHTLPYLGTIKWKEIMETLGRGGYDRQLIYEMKFVKKMPEPLREPAAKFAVDLGRYLIGIADGARTKA